MSEVSHLTTTSILLSHTPENFHAGKTALCPDHWSSVTTDPWIHECVDGYRIDFERFPYQRHVPRQLQFPKREKDLIDAELPRLLTKHIIEPAIRSKGDYISNIFPRVKKDGTVRIILNLSSLNEYVEHHHFKMDTLKSAIMLMQKDCFFASVDLKDAYYSIPIADSDRKFMRFYWDGQLYQFTCLANGLSSAPRVFTKVMKSVFSTLRKYGHINTSYIDDSLLLADSFERCVNNVTDTVHLMDSLGFTVHPDKSILHPTQCITYLGFVLNSVDMTVKPTQEKARKIKRLCESFLHKTTCSIREFSELIGNLVACEQAVKYAALHYKHLELVKNFNLKQRKGNYDGDMTITHDCIEDIQWWISNIENTSKEVTLPPPTVTLTSDASGYGWGATVVDTCQSTGGMWSDTETDLHINVLELKAILLALQSFCRDIINSHIKLLVDNMTAVIYVNKQGGTKALCNDITRQIWLWAEQNNNFLSAAHLPGVDNTLADRESRHFHVDTEWMLDRTVLLELFTIFNTPALDLFASRINHQLERYVSWRPDPTAKAIDAFTLTWNEYSYVFPPFSLLGPVLKKAGEDKSEMLLIAPLWTTQYWFSRLLHMVIAKPRLLPVKKDILVMPQNRDLTHPLLKKLHLTAFRISGNPSKAREFRRKLQTLSCSPGVTRPNASTGHITKNGCFFVTDKVLIPFLQM